MQRKDMQLNDRALEKVAGLRALLVGDFVLDAYVYGETVRVSREAPVLVVRRERTEYRLGGAANTAANLAALGVKTQVIGTVGSDTAGARLCAMLSEVGVDTGGLVSLPGHTTPVKTRILAGAFGTARQQVLRLDDEPSGELDGAVMQELAQSMARRASLADVVLISDYGMGSVGEPLALQAKALASAGRLVCVDSRFSLPRFAGATAVTPNVPEAEGVVGFAIHDQNAALRAGALLLERLQCEVCLLTQGRHGMTLFSTRREPVHIDIVGSEEVTDVTGAGDAVIATFSAGMAAGLGEINAMKLANCAAGVVVSRVGTVAVTPTELLGAMRAGEVELQAWA